MNKLLERFGGVSVLVFGDLMLDQYLSGSADRISPEAPVPILKVSGRRSVLGGAANVAANVRGLGARVSVAGVVGKDPEAAELIQALEAGGINGDGVLVSGNRPTTVKTRLIAQHHQFARFDRESSAPLDDHEFDTLAETLEKALPEADAVIVSDYAKGVVTASICTRLITKAVDSGIPVFVDPKGVNYSKYKHSALLTPNEKEAVEAARFLGFNDGDVAEAGEYLRSALELPALLVTRGEKGMTLFQADGEPANLRAEERRVFDVTGAGDTVIATVAVAFAAGADLVTAAELANTAAGSVVERLGTSAVSLEDLTTGPEAA